MIIMTELGGDIDELARNIPKGEVIRTVKSMDPKFKSRKKAVYLEKLKQLAPQEYKSLAIYHSAIRESRLFLFILKEQTLRGETVSKILTMFKPKEYVSPDGEVYEILNTNNSPEKKSIFFTIRIHSNIKKFGEEKPDMDGHYDIEYRQGRIAVVFYHYEHDCCEIRTSSHVKAKAAAKFLSEHVFGQAGALELYKLTEAEKKKLADGKTEHKEIQVKFSRPFHGCNQMILKGENVESVLAFLAEKGIRLDSERHAILTRSKVTSNDQTFSFYGNGKITVKKKIKEPFDLISKVIFSK